MKVLTLRFGKETHEIHMLNVGELFEGFGGSKRGLVVGENQPPKKRTASLIVRRNSVMGTEDKEMDIHDPTFWAWMARMLNGSGPDEATVDTGHPVVGLFPPEA